MREEELAKAPVVLLAGGLGTRIKAQLNGIPKPMVQAFGRPFIEWVVRRFARDGFSRFLISTGYLGDVIEEHFRCKPVDGCEVTCVREATPMGTAGGFLHAIRLAGGEARMFVVANADSLVLSPVGFRFAAAWRSGAQGGLVALEVEDGSRYGTLRADAEGWLLNFQEKRPGPGAINAGVYWFASQCLKCFPASAGPMSFEFDVFPTLLRQRIPLKVELVRAPFLDIGTPESLLKGEDFIRSNLSLFR